MEQRNTYAKLTALAAGSASTSQALSGNRPWACLPLQLFGRSVVAVALLAALLGLPGAARAAVPVSSLFADEVVARGKGFEILQSQLDEAIIAFRANAAARRQVITQPRAEVETAVLDKLIVIAALNQRATEPDRVAATNSANKIIGDLQKQTGDASAYERQLRVAGVTPEKFRGDVIERAVSENVLDRELKTEIEMPAERTRAFYQTNLTRFQAPETFRIAHVLIATVDPVARRELPAELKQEKRTLADKVLARAQTGEEMAALAKEFSDDPTTRDKGGELRLARGQAAPELESAIAALNVGQLSGVVTTPYGFHVLKLLERQPPRTLEFTEVEPRIKESLIAAELEKRMPAYLDKLKQEAGVQVIKPR